MSPTCRKRVKLLDPADGDFNLRTETVYGVVPSSLSVSQLSTFEGSQDPSFPHVSLVTQNKLTRKKFVLKTTLTNNRNVVHRAWNRAIDPAYETVSAHTNLVLKAMRLMFHGVVHGLDLRVRTLNGRQGAVNNQMRRTIGGTQERL